MLPLLVVADAEVLFLTRLIATLPKFFYFFFWGSIAPYANQKKRIAETYCSASLQAKFHKSLAKQFL